MTKKNTKKYVIDCWQYIEVEDEEPLSWKEVVDEIANLEGMCPENIYSAREVSE